MRSMLVSNAAINVNRKSSGRHRSYVKHQGSARHRHSQNARHHDSMIASGPRGSIHGRHRKSAYDWDSMRMKSDVSFRRGSSVSQLFSSLDENVVAEL